MGMTARTSHDSELDYPVELAKVLTSQDRLHCYSTVILASPPGGEQNSIARTLSAGVEPRVLAVSDLGLSWWGFTYQRQRRLPPLLEHSIARLDVVSFTDTGYRVATDIPVARISFKDGSFADYRLLSRPCADFWTAVASFGAG